jgi:hypothetical protein
MVKPKRQLRSLAIDPIIGSAAHHRHFLFAQGTVLVQLLGIAGAAHHTNAKTK